MTTPHVVPVHLIPRECGSGTRGGSGFCYTPHPPIVLSVHLSSRECGSGLGYSPHALSVYLSAGWHESEEEDCGTGNSYTTIGWSLVSLRLQLDKDYSLRSSTARMFSIPSPKLALLLVASITCLVILCSKRARSYIIA